MKIISRDFLRSLAEEDNSEVADAATEKMGAILYATFESISKTNPLVSLKNLNLLIINEFANGAFTANSELTIFVCLDAPQLELNSIKEGKKFWVKFKDRLRYAWNHRKSNKKKKRRRKTKEKPIKDNATLISTGKYTIENLNYDIQREIIHYLSPTTVCYRYSDKIKIIGKDEFGIKINLYPVIKKGDNCQYYNPQTKKFTFIKLSERFESVKTKYDEVGENFIYSMRIFNSIFQSKYDYTINQLFLESLFFNIPNDLYDGDDIAEIFIEIVNYLKMSSIETFVSIQDKNLKLFEDKTFIVTKVEAIKFIKELSNDLI